jgi:hypothetical protein
MAFANNALSSAISTLINAITSASIVTTVDCGM